MANNNKVTSLKEQGNKALNEGKFAEAMLHYTHAIKLDPDQCQLYSNRSLAFLKLQQYYYALQDAKQVIRLNPQWAKGYFRKGEVEFESGHYEDAIESYRLALQHDSDQDSKIKQAFKKSKDNLQKQKYNDYQVPWIGAAIGLVLGMAVIAYDTVGSKLNGHPYIKHPFLKIIIIILLATLIFYLAKMQRSYSKNYRDSLLKPPLDLSFT